jgi:ATP-dependent RNA helicase DeaD
MAPDDFAPETAPDSTPHLAADAPAGDAQAPDAGAAATAPSAHAAPDPAIGAVEPGADPSGAQPADADGGPAVPEEPEVPGAPFTVLGLRQELVTALVTLGYEEPTPIQREAIPVLLAGRDVLGIAATGTGKTAAFALPLLQRIVDGATPRGAGGAAPRALVLVPTRELCMQVAEAIHKYGRGFGTRVLAVYGGAAMGQQLRALDRGVDVVVATPGRALDHVNRGTLKLDAVRVLVLDEADEMLDMGFEEDLTAIVGATPTERQTALFSATMAPRVAASPQLPARARARRGGAPPARRGRDAARAQHRLPRAARAQDRRARPRARHGGADERHRVLPHAHEADELTETLAARGFGAEALHGGMGQEARDRVMRRFRGGQVELLVATDVAARGLDVEHVSHVVNYDVPSAPDAYVHRVGRTGRAGREGVAITIAEPRERGPAAQHRARHAPEARGRARADARRAASRRSSARRGGARAARGGAPRAAVPGTGATRDDVVAADGLGAFRAVAEVLSAEFDLLDVTAAALRLAHEAESGAEFDDADIPSLHPRDGDARGEGRRPGSDRERPGRFERGGRGERFERPERGERPSVRPSVASAPSAGSGSTAASGRSAASARRARRGAPVVTATRYACS